MCETELSERALAKLLYENDILKPCFSYFPLPLAIFLWLPVVGLPVLDVVTDFYSSGTFKSIFTLNRKKKEAKDKREIAVIENSDS